MDEWIDYAKQTKHLRPRKLLIEGMKYVQEYRYALDFGAGGLRDTRYIRKFPFKEIDLLDSCEETKNIAKRLKNKKGLNVYIQKFEDFDYIANKYDLINAQFSLPFIKKNMQKEILNKLVSSLTKNGVFVGNFLGINDAWNDGKHLDMTFYKVGEVKNMLKDLKIIHFKEKEYSKQGIIDRGIQKWHIIEFVGIKE